MQLLTDEIKNNLPPLYSTENTSTNDKKVVCKFFNPIGAGTWYVVEGEEQEDGDWLFFGLVKILESEWGYFSLRELEIIELVNFGLGIERDINFQDNDITIGNLEIANL